MSTTENNKLIAGFMGFYHSSVGYDRSWELLMPVVEKIEDISHRMFYCRKHKQYYSVRVSIQKNIFVDKSFLGFNESKILAYYEAVVEFIKWYYENK